MCLGVTFHTTLLWFLNLGIYDFHQICKFSYLYYFKYFFCALFSWDSTAPQHPQNSVKAISRSLLGTPFWTPNYLPAFSFTVPHARGSRQRLSVNKSTFMPQTTVCPPSPLPLPAHLVLKTWFAPHDPAPGCLRQEAFPDQGRTTLFSLCSHRSCTSQWPLEGFRMSFQSSWDEPLPQTLRTDTGPAVSVMGSRVMTVSKCAFRRFPQGEVERTEGVSQAASLLFPKGKWATQQIRSVSPSQRK